MILSVKVINNNNNLMFRKATLTNNDSVVRAHKKIDGGIRLGFPSPSEHQV